MIYEPETYYREGREANRVTHLPTGITYNSLIDASTAAGVSLYKMRKYIADGTEWRRDSGVIHVRKEIMCKQTGEIYESIAAAARALGTEPSTVSAQLAGRIKSVKGFHFEYTGRVTAPKPTRKRTYKRVWRDDKGRTAVQIAREYRLPKMFVIWAVRVDPENKFREGWTEERVFRSARHDGKWWWINGKIPLTTITDFRAALRAFGIKVKLKEARQLTGDLFR